MVRQPPGVRQPLVTPREAFFYNSNPHRIMEDFPPEKWRAVLREIERQHRVWDGSRTPEQTEWAQEYRLRGPMRTLAAARRIVAAL